MKWLNFLMIYYKIFWWIYAIHLLVVMFLFADGLIQGWMGAEDMISLGGFELSASTIYFSLSIYNGKQIVYIEIERKTATIMDVRKRQYVLPFHEIDHIVYTSEKCVIRMKNNKSLWTYRKIWRPYVKKDGKEHQDILPTDFVGVRIHRDC